MKIGIVCNALANSGGMERYTLDIIRGFVSAGHELTVFTRKIDRSLYEATLVKTVKINASFLPKRLRDFYISNLLPGLRKKYPVDVMLGCCRSRHVVAHSRLVEGEIRTYYQIPVQRLFLIPPPVDLSIFKPQKDEGEKPCGIRLSSFPQLKDKTTFLFVSSSHARKGFKLLEKYFENTDLPIALAVAGRPISRKDYKNICYVGYEKNMAALYAQTDFSILASIYEPFGLVPIESLCMGVPVAISENLGCKDYISKAVKEEFNPFSIDSLDNAIRNCLNRKDSMTEASKKGASEKFLVDFSLDKHISKLLEVCELARKENAN